MKPRPQLIPAAVLAVALAAAIGAAHADSVPRGASVDLAPRFCADMDAKQAAHLAFVEVKLNLTPAQKDDFRRLADALKAAHEPLRALCKDQPDQAAALPARLDRQLKQAEAHVEALKRSVPALTRFYQTLTPAQQTIADQVLTVHGGHGGPGGPGHHRGPGQPGNPAPQQPSGEAR
ncbi:Spy/CpxP family protein refolding chaperone [Magnetospirillum molischianum]|uniref:LTXXQ motif family protein n=1 Tax=Magnetospirillum molischianum DSM 120 TaxID=1150626 RepID=H8FU93_MAGML|nr:Spy/CpxP family protein refolding chaperone [Magnetospirillum molischianum]CCG41931.1 conserved exported hypothetical protein [Magnetospirillum molischianum DSM 120]